ncbi:MAG: MucBP domain-containing protein, partial [Eubacterium sp.]|nr:MucBP domain-containing protein [Eubacterium sp.]
VSASVKDVTGMVDKLYYVLDMGTADETDPAVLDTKNGNGAFQNMGGVIQRPKSWQAGEVHTVSVWVMNDANAMSTIKTVAIFIEDNEDQGDVMRPAQSASITFAANGGSGSAPATMNAYELQTVSLPNNTFTAPAGKTFGGWQDPSGNVYPAGSDYKVPENLTNHTIQLKAYWINTNESYYYLDIYEEQLNGNYKKTNATITSGVVNTAVNLSASSLTVPEGMKFNASKSKLSGTIVNAANPLHLTAYFDRLDLKVTFDNGLSSKANDVVNVKYGATVADSAIKTVANQTYADFGGWFTNIGGKGNAFTSDRKIKDNVTVYAYWIPKTVNITFDYNYTNPRSHNLAGRRTSCELTPEATAGYELNLAGKISNYPVNPARYQDTNGDTFRFDGWYLGTKKIDANTLFNYEPTTVTAKWVKVAAIACVAEGNGTVDGQGFYDLGSDVTVSWTADPGYHVSHILIDGKWVGGDHVGDTKHLFANINENHSVLVRFQKDGETSSGHQHPDVIKPEDTYHLITTHKHGTSKINLTDSFSVKDGEDAKVEWSVPSGYKITKILVNGINRPNLIDKPFGIVENVDQDYTVDVYAEPITNFVQQNGYYSIDTAINHGTITNSASVEEGSDFTVNWTIAEGYHPTSIQIDGVEIDDLTKTSVSFNDIKENHQVVVKCKADDTTQTPGTPGGSGDNDNTDDKDLLVNTAIYGGPGSITPSSFVSSGDSTTVKWNITADIPEQYEIGYVYVDGELVPLDENKNLEYTFDGVADDHKVEVYLIPNLVQFNVSYEGRGNVSPSQTLLYATDYNLVATPESGWTLSKIFMDGKQIYPEQTSLLSRVAAFFSGNDTDTHANQNFTQTYNVVEEHEVNVVFAHENGDIDEGARVQLNTQLNGTNNGTISPSRRFVAGRDNNDIVEWTVPENYTVESIYARTDKTENLTEIKVTGNSLTINDIITQLHQTNESLEVINDIYFIVNAKPVPVVNTADPIEYFDLTTEIDNGGQITPSMEGLEKGEKVTVNWSTDDKQWVSKVIIDGEERQDLVEKNSVDLVMDKKHTVKVVLNLAATKYYLDTYLQLTTGEYVLANSYPFDTVVGRDIELDPITNGELTIPGYTFNSDLSKLKGTATGLSKPLHVTAYFDRIMNLNVQYVDEDGMEIEDGKYNYSDTYKWNDSYKAKEKEIYGYTLTETPENESGRMTNDITVKYVYKLNDASVVVNYLDENGNKIPAEIQDSTTLNGKVFEPFETEPKEIYGYQLDTDRLPVETGTFTDEEQTVNYYYKLMDSSVILKFVDEKGEELSPDRIIEGKVYDDYTDEAQDILDEVLASDRLYGYQLLEEPLMDNNGKIAESQMTIVCRFELKGALVEVQFVDTDGKEIDDSEIIEGTVFAPYKTSPREIRGYTLDKTPSNASGNFIDGKVVVKYTYQANEAYVIVNYKGTDGEKLGTEKLSGRVAQKYKTEAKKFNGYQLTAEPVNATGKYKVDTITVNYVYAPDDTSLIVNYLNKNGKAVADSIAEYGKFNQHYRTIPKAVYGYELVEVPKNASGKYTQHKVVVNYTYQLKDAVVIANYVDINGEKLAESETINGKFFDEYKTKAKTISGYQLTATPSNSRGDINADEVIVDYVYVPKDTSVIVNYKDIHGKSIETSVALNGKVLEPYATEAKKIYGYALVETPENATGIYSDDQIIVDYIYDTKDTKVIVKYVDEKGKELAKSDTIKGKVFDDYSTSAKFIYGYKQISDSGNTAGEMTEETITVTYTYKQYLNIDTNGDGKPDVDIDTDGDGKPDINIDTTGDGKPNVNIDTDGDGKPDTNIDTTGDLKPNVNIDT